MSAVVYTGEYDKERLIFLFRFEENPEDKNRII